MHSYALIYTDLYSMHSIEIKVSANLGAQIKNGQPNEEMSVFWVQSYSISIRLLFYKLHSFYTQGIILCTHYV